MRYMQSFFSAAAILTFAFAAQGASAPAPAPLTDAQVLGLLSTANDAEINMAQVAVTKAQNNNVKAFAAKMITDHTANKAEIAVVETKSGLKRADSDASTQLKKDADAMVDSLKNAKSTDFDKSYISGQVTMHQNLLNALDTTLIPGAKNADVKAYLTNTRAAVQAHLQLAQKIQGSLEIY